MHGRVICGCLAVSVLALAGCGSDNGDAPALTPDQPVTVALPTDINTFNPITAGGSQADNTLFTALYDTLVRQSLDGSGKFEPQLATKWTVSDDSRTFTFDIREGATCADGDALDAAAVAASLRYASDPATPNGYASLIFGPGGVDSITNDDAAQTVTITTKAPWAALMNGLAESAAAIVCPAGLADTQALELAPAGSGPYALERSARGDEYVLKLRTDSVPVLPPGISLDKMPKQLTFRVISNGATTANLLMTDEIQAGSIATSDFKRLRESGRFTEVTGTGLGADAMLYNENSGRPGADIKVRQALNALIDRDKATAAYSAGLGKPIATLITPGMECYSEQDASVAPTQDLAAAERLLTEAGYVREGGIWTKDGRPLTMTLLGGAAQNSGPAYIQSVWQQFGVDTKTVVGQPAQHDALHAGDFDAVVFELNSPTSAPELLVNQLSGPLTQSINFAGVKNADFEAIIAPAAAAHGDERCALWSKGQKALMENADANPIQANVIAWFGRGVTFQASFWYLDSKTLQVVG